MTTYMMKTEIEKAAADNGIVGKMNIVAEVKKIGVSYERLTSLMNGKGSVDDLVNVLAHFGRSIKVIKSRRKDK